MNKSLLIAMNGMRAETLEEAAEIAENPGFIEARDTEWDEGVNYAKRYIAEAIRQRSRVHTALTEAALSAGKREP